MAKPRRAKKRRWTEPASWTQFAALSRDILQSGSERGANAKGGRARARDAAPQGETSSVRATSQALKLGRKQAAWVVEQRKQKLAQRAKAISAASRSKRAGKKQMVRDLPEGVTTARKALAARAAGSRGVLVAEGDSWFDYPFHDVLKELDDAFGWEIEQVAHNGDTVESMAYDGGQLDDFVRAIEKVARRGKTPHAILVSGGGNDIAGDGFGMLLNHRSSPVHGLDPDVIAGVLATRVRVAYTTILSAVTAACRELLGAPLPILLHGYDHPVPDGRGFLGGWGWLPGPWLAPGFLEKGYDDLAERIALARELIDRFYTVLGEVVGMPQFGHVQLIDVRGALSVDLGDGRYRDWWDNELHPTRAGFHKIAGMFDEKL